LEKKEIKAHAAMCGFAACGIAAADDFPDYETALDVIVKAFPETWPLYQPMYRRARVKENFPWAKSIIVCVRDYARYRIPEEVRGHIGRNYLFDSRVAANPDYLMIKRFTGYLKGSGLRVRKGGVPDRLAAARAGVASIGRNNFAYAETCGSWLNLVTYVVDAELVPDNPSYASCCPPGCDICIRACPTGALVKPYLMRMDRCIAFLTYGADAAPGKELAALMGGWVYGCDVCQEVCPLNEGKWREKEELPCLEKEAGILSPEALSKMDEKTCRERVYPLFPYIPAENAERWRNNAKRVLNST